MRRRTRPPANEGGISRQTAASAAIRSGDRKGSRRTQAGATAVSLPRGFHTLIAAQFCSALADNALLIVAIALLVALQMPPC